MFAGLTFCHCGKNKKMYVLPNSPKYACSACHNKIPIVDLEGVFLDELRNYLLSPDKLAAYLKGANEAISENTRLLDSLRKQLKTVKENADKTHALYVAGGLTVLQFKERYQPLDDRRRQLEEEIPSVEAKLDVLRVDGFSSDQIIAEAQDLHSRWPKMTFDERRRIVELLVKDITIGNGEISLNLCYRPSFEEMTIKQRSV